MAVPSRFWVAVDQLSVFTDSNSYFKDDAEKSFQLSEEIQVEHLKIELVTKIQWATGLKANQKSRFLILD